MAKAKRPSDTNQRAKQVVDIATGETTDPINENEIKSAAAILGRKGGLKGGKARKEALTPERRKEIAIKAAQKRWGQNKE
ncbi:histone H1 [Flavisolibacter nicotianae]|uniref:histone H1 n=1 Tax=Flavisolibacter nicotianae TaxID=2364882 RepID=UPI000EAF0B1E|nr:histone H1 [Flavisolibacter nicotianae]